MKTLCPFETQRAANYAMQCITFNITEGQNLYQFLMLAKSLHCVISVISTQKTYIHQCYLCVCCCCQVCDMMSIVSEGTWTASQKEK